MKYCDLHIHTYCSDGTFSPKEVVERAKIFGLSGIAIADHDSVSAVNDAKILCASAGIEFAPAIEFSTSELDGRMHLLGYYIDYKFPPLLELASKLAESRKTRIIEMCRRMTELGYPTDIADIEKISNGATIGRPHLAAHLINIGAVHDLREAFERFIAGGRPAYIRKWAPPPEEIIELIHKSGGFAIAAHPGVTTGMMKIIPRLIEIGIDGVEAYYPKHSHEDQQKLIEYAKNHDLLVTGGSDCHGFRRGEPLLGVFKVKYELLSKMKERWEKQS